MGRLIALELLVLSVVCSVLIKTRLFLVVALIRYHEIAETRPPKNRPPTSIVLHQMSRLVWDQLFSILQGQYKAAPGWVTNELFVGN